MKTLFITSIYANLWGTEFGGRPSREHHYRLSLLNILNTNPTKVVCFTSSEEIELLKSFFYKDNGVSKEKLELVVFDLTNSKYFDLIHSKKNLEKIKKSDRCFEIQYNKFFWFDLIEDRFEYDRVYWIDAGLSHGALFPREYRKDQTFTGHYTITLFTPEFLTKLNNNTSEKPLILMKNNTSIFTWSQTIPQNYYNKFDKSFHVVGGMFGGTPNKYLEIRNKFENLLVKLLAQEDELYMEEQLLSCIYFNNPEFFYTEIFDDWYKREKHPEDTYKYFFKLFL